MRGCHGYYESAGELMNGTHSVLDWVRGRFNYSMESDLSATRSHHFIISYYQLPSITLYEKVMRDFYSEIKLGDFTPFF